MDELFNDDSPVTIVSSNPDRGPSLSDVISAPALAVIGGADTVVSSLTFGAADNSVVSDMLLNNKFGEATGLYQRYKENEEGYKLAGELASLFIGAGMATTALKAGQRATALARGANFVKTADEVGAFAGYIGGTGASEAATITSRMPVAADNLAQLRSAFAFKDSTYGAAGVNTLENAVLADRAAALSNIRRTGLVETAGELVAGEAAALLLLNQSTALFPEGMTAKEYLLTTAAFGGLFAAGSALRTAGAARASAREAGLAFGQAEAKASTPTAAAAGDEAFNLAANFDLRRAHRTLEADGRLDPVLREAAISKRQVLEVEATNTLKGFGEKADPVFATPARLTAEQVDLVRNFADGSNMQGLRAIRNSEQTLFDQAERRSKALASIKTEIDQLHALDQPTIMQQDRLVAARAKFVDAQTQRVTHVMSDGVMLVDGEAPVHLGWRGSTSRFDGSNPDAVAWTVKSAHRIDAPVVEVRADFRSTLEKPNKAELIQVNALAKAFGDMLASPAFGEQLAKVEKIDVGKLRLNPIALSALGKHIDTLDDAAAGTFLRKLQLPPGLDSLDKLRDWSLAQQAQSALDILKDRHASAMRLRKTTTDAMTPYELSMRTGLAMHNADGTANGLMEHLLGLAQMNRSKVPKVLGDELAMREMKAQTGALGRTADLQSIKVEAAKPLTFDVTGYNWKLKPVALINSGAEQDAHAMLTARDAMRSNKQNRLARLARSEEALLGEIRGAEDEAASGASLGGVNSLVTRINDVLGSLGPEFTERLETAAAGVLAGQNRTGVVTQGLTSRSFQIDEVLGGALARAAQQRAHRASNAYIAEQFSEIVRLARDVAEPINRGHQFSFNAYLTAMQLKLPVLAEMNAGRIAIDTKNPAAVKIWNKLFPEQAIREGQSAFLPDPAMLAKGVNQPLVLTEKAQGLVTELQRLVEMDWIGKNQIRYANKEPLIAKRPHYLPYVPHNNLHQVFITDKDGRVASMVAGSSYEAAKANARERVVELAKRMPDDVYNVIDSTDVKRFREAHGQSVTDTITWATEGMSKGQIANLLKIDEGADLLKSYLDELQSSARGQVIDTIRTHYKEALGGLSLNQAAAKTALRTSNAETGLRSADDAYTLFEEALTGYAKAKPDSWTARLDDFAQRISAPVTEAYDKYAAKTFGTVKGAFDVLKGRAPKAAEWEQIAKKLETEIGYAPFTNALDRAAATANFKPPAELRAAMQSANSHAAYMVLRLFETSYGLVNAISPVVMGPAQMRLLKALPDESATAHQFRVGDMAYAAHGQAIPNPHGVLIQGLREMRDPAFQQYYGRFVDKPLADGDMLRLMERVDRPASEAKAMWAKIFNGDKGYATAVARRGDEFGQAWSHAAAYAMLKRSGIEVSDPVVQALAFNIGQKVNTVTGPADKADFFKTIPGLPFGLFQSFANNYLQSMVQMVERGDVRSLLTQYAAQGMMFGMHSLPGWQQLNDLTFRNWDGSKTLDDQISERLGRGAYDAVMNGPIWSVPKLLGGHGVGIYTRGDANIRPALGNIGSIADLPSISVLTNSYNTLSSTMRILGSAGQADAAWEALVRSVPNRPIKGLLELTQGYATDRGGQMTSDTTQDWSAGLYRLMGAKTMTEIEAARLSWQLKGVENKHRAEVAKLRVEAQAYFRSGDYEGLNDMALRYVRAGGRPESFARWYNETARIATSVRADRELAKAADKATVFSEINQLSQAMTSR